MGRFRLSKTCHSCGHEVDTGHKFCGSCGSPLKEERVGRSAESVYESSAPMVHRARLRLVRGDSADGFVYHLQAQEHPVGREVGSIEFPEDTSVSAHHATFFYKEDRLYVRDEGSLNGVFLRLRDSVPIDDGEVFLCGEQVLRFDCYRPGAGPLGPDGAAFCGTPLVPWKFRVVQLLEGHEEGCARCCEKVAITIGREDCDLNFPLDRFISRYHSRIEEKGDEFVLRDLDSRNGTYFRLKREVPLSNGDQIFIGRQLLRVEIL